MQRGAEECGGQNFSSSDRQQAGWLEAAGGQIRSHRSVSTTLPGEQVPGGWQIRLNRKQWQSAKSLMPTLATLPDLIAHRDPCHTAVSLYVTRLHNEKPCVALRFFRKFLSIRKKYSEKNVWVSCDNFALMHNIFYQHFTWFLKRISTCVCINAYCFQEAVLHFENE